MHLGSEQTISDCSVNIVHLDNKRVNFLAISITTSCHAILMPCYYQ